MLYSKHKYQNMHNSDQQQIPAISHSLEADLATGWKPKLKIIGPMPLNFDNPNVDSSIMALVHQQSAFYQVVYMGARPISSFKLHELVAKHYRYKYSYLLYNDFAHLKPFFKKFYSLFESEVKRPFHGMNPHLHKKELIFDSCFEGGNLDCAVRLRAQEYDLLLRVDSNTAGHVLWYHFKVTNAENVGKKVKFNICNLRKNKSAYERGMRPFVRRDRQKPQETQQKQEEKEQYEWQQEGDNVVVSYERLRYHKQNLMANIEASQQPTVFRKVSFQLSLGPQQTVELAYSIPYSYSLLLQHLKQFRKKAQKIEGLQIDYDYENESLSGLEIPIMKIRLGAGGNGKYCVFIIGRQHPGESNSSHVIKGTIEQLLSGEEMTMKILKYCDFVVIPMINPDGVVAGNFRTSLFGKDLNRLFKAKDTTLTPEIEMTRTVFTELYQVYKKKLLLFLDYHGHSTRKNAFVLGPGMIDAQLLTEIRVLPKIMANYSEIFRYPSCSFRLEGSKRTTARALFGKLAGLSFTIETSNWGYYSSATKQVVQMQENHFEQLGRGLGKSVEEFIWGKISQKNKFGSKSKEEAIKKINFNKSKQDLTNRKQITSREKTEYVRKTTKEARMQTETFIEQNEAEIKFTYHEERPPSVAQANQSDEMSQSGMDSESEGEDMQKDKFKKYIKAASEMLVEFEKIYYGDLYRKDHSKYKLGQVNSKSNKLLFQKDKRKKIETIQACLRSSQKPEAGFKTEEKQREERTIRKKIFVEETFFGRDGNASRNKPEAAEYIFQEKQGGKQFKFADAHQRTKMKVSKMIKEQFAITEEVSHFQKIDFKQVERSLEGRKKEQSLDKIKFSQKSNIHIVFNRDKEPSSGSNLLPIIRGTKVIVQDNKGLAKAKDKFTDLLFSQQLLNRSTVVNVLKLSRIERQKSKEG